MSADNDLTALFVQLAKALLGDANPLLSSEHEWRYGARGSLSLDLAKATWFDFEANERRIGRRANFSMLLIVFRLANQAQSEGSECSEMDPRSGTA